MCTDQEKGFGYYIILEYFVGALWEKAGTSKPDVLCGSGIR